MNWNVGIKIATGFAATLLIFVLVAISSYFSNLQLGEATEAHRQTAGIVAARDELSIQSRGVGLSLRNYIITGTPDHRQAFLDSLPQAEKALQHLLALQSGGPGQRLLMDRLSSRYRDYLATARRLVDVRQQQGAAEAARLLDDEETRMRFERLAEVMNEVGRTEEAALARQATEAEQAAERARWTIVFGTAIGFVLAMFAGFLLTRNISTPLRQLTEAAERVTIGDLTAPTAIASRHDEIGALSRSLQRMTEVLRGMAGTASQIANGDLRGKVVPLSPSDELGTAFARMSRELSDQLGQLSRAALQLGAASTEVVASSTQLAASSSQTAAAVGETTTTVEEVRQTAHLASQKARKVSDGAKRVLEVSDQGLTSMHEVEAGMGRIRSQMEAIATSMERLSEQTRGIGQIVATVEDLANQSNLLAVNAAIEAAKAGEHGRGFSVVAQEVRALADQSRQAILQIRTMLGDIQKATDAAVSASGQGVKVVDSGVKQAESAGAALGTMAESIQGAIQASLQIAASSQQQLVGMDQVAASMNSIREASGQNLDSASKLEAAARELSLLGTDLKRLIARYQV